MKSQQYSAPSTFHLFAVVAALSLLGLAGCASGTITSANPLQSAALRGRVHGGQQPVTGAQVFLYAVSGTSNAGVATSLLTAPGYVLTDSSGEFNITGDFTCPAGSFVYLLALGGNPGLSVGTNNPELALAAGLGACSTLTASSFYTINEVTTVSFAYSMSSIASSETQIGSSSFTSLASAFANVGYLTNPSTGTALTATPTVTGTVPQAKIDSLANSLAPCINSTGIGAPCASLMADANVVSGGATPVDTFQAALNIAHNPTVNVGPIFGLANASSPFQPHLGSAPSDWTIAVQLPKVSVTLTPSSSTLSQSASQTFTASLGGATGSPFSYLWTATSSAGLLNEIGGSGRTNQTSYCSTSPQASYTANASPALTTNAADIVAVQAFTGAGCVGANSLGTARPSTVTVTPAAAGLAIGGLVTSPATVTIVLPPGIGLTPDQLTVLTSVNQATPSASGTVTLPIYIYGSQIAVVAGPSGSPLLFGWVDATHSTISAGTTAEILAYYALGGPFMFSEADRNAAEAAILNAPGLPALTQAISSEIAANPNVLLQLDPVIKSALNTFFTSVSGIVPLVRQSGVHRMGILINPGVQSGENVQQTPPFSADVTNAYRRRTHAFVQRISDTPMGSPTPPDVPDMVDVTDFEVSPTTGLTGGVAGTISDIYNYYWGNTTAAYAPTTSDLFSIPLTAGAAKTTYHVTIVGPGKNTSTYGTLTDAQAKTQADVAIGGFVTDAMIPFLANFAFGSGFPPAKGALTATSQLENFQANWTTDLGAC